MTEELPKYLGQYHLKDKPWTTVVEGGETVGPRDAANPMRHLMQQADLRTGEIAAHIEDLACGRVLVADNGTAFRVITNPEWLEEKVPVMDFDNITRLPVNDPEAVEPIDAELRPMWDPSLRTYSAQLYIDGKMSGILGETEGLSYIDQVLGGIDAFLAGHGVRALTGDEAFLLYAGLVHAKGGADWAMFQMNIAASEQL